MSQTKCKNCRRGFVRSVAIPGCIIAMVVLAGMTAKDRFQTHECVATTPEVVELRASIEACKADRRCRVLAEDIRLIRTLEGAAREQCRRTR